jgi:hypothetical protein
MGGKDKTPEARRGARAPTRWTTKSIRGCSRALPFERRATGPGAQNALGPICIQAFALC